MAAGRTHNFAFFLLTFYFPNWPINQFESIMQNKPNLLDALMNVTSVLTKYYENKRLADVAKTKPIQTQFKANTNPIPERPKMNENLFATKVYENITTFRLEQNKPNQTQKNPPKLTPFYMLLSQHLKQLLRSHYAFQQLNGSLKTPAWRLQFFRPTYRSLFLFRQIQFAQ